MRVLVMIRNIPSQRYLVHLQTKTLIDEVRALVNNKRHFDAIAAILTKGRIDRIVDEEEIPNVAADLMLSDSSASWDLTC